MKLFEAITKHNGRPTYLTIKGHLSDLVLIKHDGIIQKLNGIRTSVDFTTEDFSRKDWVI